MLLENTKLYCRRGAECPSEDSIMTIFTTTSPCVVSHDYDDSPQDALEVHLAMLSGLAGARGFGPRREI